MTVLLIYGDQYAENQQIAKGEKYSSIYTKPFAHFIQIVFLIIFLVCAYILFLIIFGNCVIFLNYVRQKK